METSVTLLVNFPAYLQMPKLSKIRFLMASCKYALMLLYKEIDLQVTNSKHKVILSGLVKVQYCVHTGDHLLVMSASFW